MIQMSQRLYLQQKQSPQQVLLSSLLQLPVLRLEQRITQELELNPLLEEDLDIEEIVDMNEDTEEKEDSEEEEPEEEEIDWDEILNDEDNYEIKSPRERPDEEQNRIEPSPVTFMDYLMDQLYLAPLDDKGKEIGKYILWCLDDDGYLVCDIEAIAENFEITPDKVEKVLSVIQKFDPPGIAARNLQECLLIQLREKKDADELAIKMVAEYFEDFTNKRFEKISKKLEIPLNEVKRIMDFVAKLNPKPGYRYISESESYIIPDVIVKKEDGKFTISLNDYNIPRLRINNTYKNLLRDKKNVSKDTRDYIRQKLESARWLINSIYQRRSTILRVMESILNHQRAFFDKGKEYLRPMILKDIAEEVGLDISTVSRVTSGKYVQTDFGIFELKYFFSERLETDSGESVSNKLIKSRIKEIIEKENPKKPFNDQKISEMLKEDGYRVARRTVAKYREQMMIPVARLRRKI
ncbi:RNA polymerase factor sigma-54 [bacterium]|nr:RNA polymerase factor sigma-54 [bacterium]